MPLAAQGPTDRVEQLIILTERLTEIIMREIGVLKDRRPAELKSQTMTSARVYENVDILREDTNVPVALVAKRPGEIQSDVEAAAGIDRGDVGRAPTKVDSEK